jgi:hypothetical protein
MTKRITPQPGSPLHPDAPLLHPDHRRPRTRREFLAQSLMLGSGTVLAGNLLSLFPQSAQAALSQDLANQVAACNPSAGGGSMVPFLCFDLAGGANIAGSNALVGGRGGQLDPLSAQGYSLLGLPANMLPNASIGSFIDTSLGVAFHTDSAFLRGMRTTCGPGAMANVNGCVIPARSENDTGNNPHNPMYGIYRAGARGELINLVGSQNSDSGGNSMAPTMLIDVSARPTQVTRPSDVTSLVGSAGDLPRLLGQNETVAAMESVARVSNAAIDGAATYYPSNAPNNDFESANPGEYAALRTTAKCEIAKSADSADKFGVTSPDPTRDPAIAGGGPNNLAPIFPGGVASDGEFMKTASIMKLVLGAAGTGHYAAAGTISMGGFDYHTGERGTGEMRDFRAGQCMGACIEYAHRMQTKLMLYVFSDGSLSSNGMPDNSIEGRGKNNWDSDNQATGAALMLVYQPGSARATTLTQQLGWMRTDGSVEIAGSPGANSVTQLVDMVVLNYLALHGTQSLDTRLAAALNRPAGSILGGAANWDKYIAFAPLA